MSANIDSSFPHPFTCAVLDELPGTSVRQHYFAPEGRRGQDGIVIEVQPSTGERWFGTFAFGDFGRVGVTKVMTMPDPQKLCVIARGAGYVVSASNPEDWESVPAVPITDVRPIPAAALVVFATYTDILAYGEQGVRWRTPRLAWDGLKIVAIGDQTLVGEYWDLRAEALQRFQVDLATGAARGGVES